MVLVENEQGSPATRLESLNYGTLNLGELLRVLLENWSNQSLNVGSNMWL